MDYTIKMDLGFSEILTLDAALNHYFHEQLISLRDYSDHPAIIDNVKHELENVRQLVEQVETVMFGGVYDEK